MADRMIGGRYLAFDRLGPDDLLGSDDVSDSHLVQLDDPQQRGKWLVLRVLRPDLAGDPEIVERFFDEARVTAAIHHPNVVQVFDFGSDDGVPWMVSEALHGVTVKGLVERLDGLRNRLRVALAVHVASEAAEGLHAAHELRSKHGDRVHLVHRKVAPRNLFLGYDGAVEVIDFGSAKWTGRRAATLPNALIPVAAYLSPEQVRGAQLDRTTDVFALGVVLWELIAGRSLFAQETALDTLEAVAECEVPKPSAHGPDCPDELDDIVLRALAKRKQERFATMSDFSRALRGFLLNRRSRAGKSELGRTLGDLFEDAIKERERYLAGLGRLR